MTDVQSSAVEAAVRETAERFPGVLVAYLFGSTVTGRTGPLSDVDVAVLVSGAARRQGVHEAYEDALCRALGSVRLDLVCLNKAPSPLAYRVIRDGRLVFCRDPRAREAFEVATVMRYLDFQPVRNAAFQAGRRRILETA